MKTAMQKFISGIDTYETDETMTIIDRMERAENFIEVLRKRAYLLLEAEKQQIIDASVQANLRYDSGANEAVVLRYCNDAEQYYNQKYK